MADENPGASDVDTSSPALAKARTEVLAYLRDNKMIGDDQIMGEMKTEHLLTPELYLWRKRDEMGGNTPEYKKFKAFFDEIIAHQSDIAEKNDIKQNVALLDKTGLYSYGIAASITSAEGTNYTFLTPDYIEAAYAQYNNLEKLKSYSANADAVAERVIRNQGVADVKTRETDKVAIVSGVDAPTQGELDVIMAHEVSHNKYGDTTAEGIYRSKGIDTLRAEEIRADLNGAVTTDNPDAFISFLKKTQDNEISYYVDAHSNEKMPEVLTPEYLQKVSKWWQETHDPGHPLTTQRIEALQDLKQEMQDHKSVGVFYTRQEGQQMVYDALKKALPGNALTNEPLSSWVEKPADVPVAAAAITPERNR